MTNPMLNCRTARLVALALLLLAAPVSQALACPVVHKLNDYNCDGALKLAVTGDSIVRGRGDPEITEENGGYVQDLAAVFKNASVVNIGIPGISSALLYRAFRKNAPRMKTTFEKLRDSDYILIEVGTNDYWESATPAATIRNIKRLRDYLMRFVELNFGTTPLIITSTLPPVKRAFQQPFIDAVNAQLLLPVNQQKLNVLVRFDLVKNLTLSLDGVHPDGPGYRKMAAKAARALQGPVQTLVGTLRRDDDQDGLFDEIESRRYGTDLLLPDTDEDGLRDGDEVFMYLTNPLNADTDGDGKSDGAEIAESTDPLDRLS